MRFRYQKLGTFPPEMPRGGQRPPAPTPCIHPCYPQWPFKAAFLYLTLKTFRQNTTALLSSKRKNGVRVNACQSSLVWRSLKAGCRTLAQFQQSGRLSSLWKGNLRHWVARGGYKESPRTNLRQPKIGTPLGTLYSVYG